MLNHTELMESWLEDSKLNPTLLLDQMYSHPILHSKYLQVLQEYKLNQRKLVLKLQKERQFMTRYFNGELTKEELDERELKQYQFRKPMKSEMETLLDADPGIQKIQEQINYLDVLISSAESIMKDIGNRYFLFRNLVEHTRFLSGNS